MAFGTFDLLHPGHVEFLRRARALGGELVVSVARDVNTLKFKGAAPVFSEKERLKLVSSISYVSKVVLGDKDDYLRHILKIRPDIIALGYDQSAYVKELKTDIKKRRISTKILRLPGYKIGRYKSSYFKNIIKRHSS